MNLIEVGRMAVKLAGRDSNKQCVIVDVVDNSYVLIDGQTRRKKCNIKHLELLNKKLEIKKGASHSVVAEEFAKLGLELTEKKPKKVGARPRAKRKSSAELREQKQGKKKAKDKAAEKTKKAVEEVVKKLEDKKAPGAAAKKDKAKPAAKPSEEEVKDMLAGDE